MRQASGWSQGRGSYSIPPRPATSRWTAKEPQRILDALGQGKLMVADPASTSRSQKAWDLSIILNEAGHRAGAGHFG